MPVITIFIGAERVCNGLNSFGYKAGRNWVVPKELLKTCYSLVCRFVQGSESTRLQISWSDSTAAAPMLLTLHANEVLDERTDRLGSFHEWAGGKRHFAMVLAKQVSYLSQQHACGWVICLQAIRGRPHVILLLREPGRALGYFRRSQSDAYHRKRRAS